MNARSDRVRASSSQSGKYEPARSFGIRRSMLPTPAEMALEAVAGSGTARAEVAAWSKPNGYAQPPPITTAPRRHTAPSHFPFYRWLMEQKGTPVTQVEEVVRTTVSGAEFARDHPGAAHHLSEAFALLWSDRTDIQVIAETGEHLRGAIMDIAQDITDGEGSAERPIEPLSSYLQRITDKLGERESAVLQSLIELVDVTLRLDQRLTHIRDETGKGRPLRNWDESRRAAFVTAFTCYEFYRALGTVARD